MARIREKLRHGGVPAAVAPAPEPAPVLVEPAEAMPFVEVGPRRYFEASADVLATAPARSTLHGPHGPVIRALTPAAPKRGVAPELVAYHAPESSAAVRYRDLLASLLEAGCVRAGGECRTLLVTAARAEIGTTTVLLELAISAAGQGLRVVVVDANLRRPAVADRLGLPAGPGLTDVLAGEATLGDAVRETAQAGLSALSAGSVAALLADEASLRDVVLELAAGYDLVLIDGPRVECPLPAGRAWDRRALALLAGACQALYLVVPAAESETAATTDLAAGLAERALPLAGCIVAA